MTTYATLHEANIARDREWVSNGAKLSGSFRGNETAGEIGESIERALDLLGYTAALAAAGGRLSNIIKKLDREAMGLKGSRATVAELGKELGDVIICAGLMAMHYGLNADREAALKFNETSEKHGFKTRVAVPGDLPAGNVSGYRGFAGHPENRGYCTSEGAEWCKRTRIRCGSCPERDA